MNLREFESSYRDVLKYPKDEAEIFSARDAVKYAEIEDTENGLDYSEQRVRIATVHTREDIILLYYTISSRLKKANEIALSANFFLLIIAGLLAAIYFKL